MSRLPLGPRALGAAALICASVVLADDPASVAATGTARAAAVGGGHGKILYGADGLLTIRRPDGSGRKTVPHTRYWSEPEWSPDGHWIVAVNGQRATVLHPNGTARHAISPKPPKNRPGTTRYATSPTWSPDGRRIAYVLQLDRKWEIRIVNRDGKLLKTLSKATRYLPSDTVWSPNGKRIAFVGTVQPKNPSPQWDIFSIKVNDSGVTRLTKTRGADEASPSWRPDGKRIVYERDYFNYRGSGAVRRQLFVMTPTGGSKHAIFEPPDYGSYMQSPAYSPDGKRVVFGYRGPDTSIKYGLRVIRDDGTGLTTVSRDFGTDASWR